jgi:dephospho-CoA kinase
VEHVSPTTAVVIIGVAGGIASGKTLVTEQLARRGAAVVSADKLAHEVLKYEEVKQVARERWGDAVFSADGEIDRAAVAKIVFAPAPEGQQHLKFLEQLTHPHIGHLARQRLELLSQEKKVPAIVLDVPLLFESGWNRLCDKIVYVDAPRDQRLSRALARGWSQEEFERREAAQQSLETKREQADFVIDNSATVQATEAQIEQLWSLLIDPPRS